MKTYFIVNPVSGKENSLEEITEKLKKSDHPYEIYVTKCKNDATELVKRICSENPDEYFRFCACGGDGTLNEVVNGAVHFDNAEVTCYPCGSGNDYVKYYGGKDRFMDVNELMTAPSEAIDLIKVGDRYSINVVNFGFDTEVCVTMEKVKSKAVIGGKNAYTTGVVKAVLTAMKTKGNVYADDELLNENNRFLLCTVANGKYIGGRFCCAPRSLNNDGLLEVCLAKKISRFTFIKLVGAYEKGAHLDDNRFSDILQYRRCKKVEIKAEKGFAITIDGEVIPGEEFTAEIAHKKLKFAVPPLNSAIKEKEKGNGNGIMIYEFDWKNPDEWQHDGTLAYDKENEVLFFDTKEDKAECSVTIEIPDDANCFHFSFEAGNSSPITRDSDSGRVRLSFLDENNTEISGFDTLIFEKEYFYKYTASSMSMPFPIPKTAEKIVVGASGTNRGKSDLNFYFKNFTLEFKNEESTEIVTDYTGVFIPKKVGDKLIKIGNDSMLTTIGLWVLLGVIAVTGAFRIVKYNKSKDKE